MGSSARRWLAISSVLFAAATVVIGDHRRVVDDSSQPARGDALILEFDLPPGYWDEHADGAFVVTGFTIGYFEPGGTRSLYTVDVTRNAVGEDGEVGRMWLPRPRLPLDVVEFVLRARTVSTEGTSDWSEPSPIVIIEDSLASR